MPGSPKLLPARELVRNLATKYENVTIDARRVHTMINNAVIPAEKIGGRYYIRTSNLPKIAKFLGLERKVSKPASIAKEAA